MKLDFNLQLQQEQKLIMTQELQMAVKILQLTSIELNEYIQEQLIENPMLEQDEKENQNDDYEKIDDMVNNLYEDNESFSENQEDSEYTSPLNYIARETTLWEYLKEQLNYLRLDNLSRKVGEYIIDNIDENGYLIIENEEINNKFKISNEKTEKLIKIIQTFEPSGICARDIRECLLIQLGDLGIYDKTLDYIIINMLEEVGQGNLSKIAEKTGASMEIAEEYVKIIKKLDPKPGIRFYSNETKYIVPDVIVEKINDKYVVTVNDEYLPQLKINNFYRKIIKDKNSPEYKYVKEKLDSALWVIKSIEQRMQTIKNVVEAIIVYQIDFFEKDEDLRPLSLHQIAEVLDIHESTVSRAVKGKYMQTPKGLFEIKKFFIRGMQNSSGEEIATLKIKNQIKALIEKEDRKKPYSDQQISQIMASEGMNISRRTVAKYREEMEIPPSSKRKIK